MVYEVFNVKNETILMRSKSKEINKQPSSENTTKKMTDDDDDEEETTIEEVIEELRNIVNDAESEQYAKDKLAGDIKSSQFNDKTEVEVNSVELKSHKDLEKKDSVTSLKHTIIITDSTDYSNQNGTYQADFESEIVPAKLLPQPPRKSKSLIHLFIPSAEQGVICNNKRTLGYDEEQQYYSSDEGSDSLLSASKCQPQIIPRPNKQEVYIKTNNRSLLNTIMDARERAAMAEKRELLRRARAKSGEEVCRRQAAKRTDSCKKNEQNVGVVNVNDLKVERDSYDGLYYIKESDDYKKDDRLQQKPKQDYAALMEAKKLTKSLDRIDEGLDSMVDIVLTSENNKNWNNKKEHPEQNNGSRSLNRRKTNGSSNRYYDDNDDDYEVNHRQQIDPSHRLYFPTSRLSSSSFDQHSGNNGSSNTSFIIKRGHANAGLYSGQNGPRDNSNVANLNRGLANKDIMMKSLSPSVQRSSSNGTSLGMAKLADMPSGLY